MGGKPQVTSLLSRGSGRLRERAGNRKATWMDLKRVWCFFGAGDKKRSVGRLSWKPATKDLGLSKMRSHGSCFVFSGSKSMVKI